MVDVTVESLGRRARRMMSAPAEALFIEINHSEVIVGRGRYVRTYSAIVRLLPIPLVPPVMSAVFPLRPKREARYAELESDAIGAVESGVNSGRARQLCNFKDPWLSPDFGECMWYPADPLRHLPYAKAGTAVQLISDRWN
jgi:hypothetical protein